MESRIFSLIFLSTYLPFIRARFFMSVIEWFQPLFSDSVTSTSELLFGYNSGVIPWLETLLVGRYPPFN